MWNEAFNEREKRILSFWKEEKIFERSLENRKDNTPYVFYDGPPFATGLPHYGHLLAGTIKDVVLRFKTMEGFYVPRIFGWDCHGLPVEQEIEKQHSLSGAGQIEKFGIREFNEACRSIVLRYTEEWEESVERMGRWIDFKNAYRTMDRNFMESVWWVFKELYNKGLVYQGYKVMPYSAKLGTPLSNFEASENYKEVEDPAITVAFPVEEEENTYFLAWTTTPWTLVSHLALMVGPEITYVYLEDSATGKKYILAESRVETLFKDREFKIFKKLLGKDLAGKRYTPPFAFFKDHENAFRVILEPSVSLDEGTGIVHTAPGFGEVDFYASLREGIEAVCPVDSNGFFVDPVTPYKGMFVKDADKLIIKDLKERGILFKNERLRHRYPFCWRSDTPLIYRTIDTWFVGVEKIKENLVAQNKKISWMPEHLKEGRFGKWLENARDWAVSRNRYWGTPLPIWKSPSGKIRVFGSIEELRQKVGVEKIEDIHRHFIDHLTFEEEGEVFHRVPEVFDCWFESGSMPYGQIHYPFEKEKKQLHLPADFIAEGLDQTRGWFYTLNVISTALFDAPAFKNVIVNGIVLAEDGAKMSKRLKNYPDPMEMIELYGADAVRLYMLMSPAVLAENLAFQRSGLELVLRQVIIPLMNSFKFFETYRSLYGWKPSGKPESKVLLDRYILSLTEHLKKDVKGAMDRYDLQDAVQPMVRFVDQLTNWYIRRSRRRFWSEENIEDRDHAFSVLHYVLKEFSKIIAPFLPFVSEALFQELRSEEEELSVHLTDFPAPHQVFLDPLLEEEMVMVQEAVSLGHGLRKKEKLKVRQPLQEAWIASKDSSVRERLSLYGDLIMDELNVKKVHFTADEEAFVKLFVKANFRTLGKKSGPLMPRLKEAVEKLTQEEIKHFLEEKQLEIQVEGNIFLLEEEDLFLSREKQGSAVAEAGTHLTVALNPELTDALVAEAIARELVNRINTLRKEKNFNVSDRITMVLSAPEHVERAYQEWRHFIDEEVLCAGVSFGGATENEIDVDGSIVKIEIKRL